MKRIKQRVKAKLMGGVSIVLAFMIGIAPVGVSAKTSGEEVIDIPVEVLEQLGITPAVTDAESADDISAETTVDETVIDTGDTAVETVEDIPADETEKEIGDTAEDLQDIALEDILAGISDYISEDETGAELGDLSEMFSDPMAQMFLEMMLVSLMKTPVEVEQMPITDGPLTPDGNMDLIDDYGNTEKAGKQFITVTTKNGNYFYIIIDRDDEGTETVHFLNMVDEADLLSLMDENAVDSYLAAREARSNKDAKDGKMAETKVTVTPEPTSDPEITESLEQTKKTEETETKKSSGTGLIFLLILVLGGAGGFIYFKKFKGRKSKASSDEDPDADYNEAEEDYIEGLADEVDEIMSEDEAANETENTEENEIVTEDDEEEK